MSEKTAAAPETVVFRPCRRAFLVYYVAMAICFLGPLINPAMGLPLWLGVILGLILVLAVAYQMTQEYQITRTGVRKVLRRGGAVQEISWENLGGVQVRRGLTQTLMNVGNIVLEDKKGGPAIMWFGLSDPKAAQAAIEKRRP